jgi:hypothetical protein
MEIDKVSIRKKLQLSSLSQNKINKYKKEQSKLDNLQTVVFINFYQINRESSMLKINIKFNFKIFYYHQT